MTFQRTAAKQDFRAGVIWIWVAMFAGMGTFQYHHARTLSWLALSASALLLAGAVHYRIQRPKRLSSKGKVSNVS